MGCKFRGFSAETGVGRTILRPFRGRGEIGRRAGFRFPWPQGLAGSIPVARITKPADPMGSAGGKASNLADEVLRADEVVVRRGKQNEVEVVGLAVEVEVAIERQEGVVRGRECHKVGVVDHSVKVQV